MYDNALILYYFAINSVLPDDIFKKFYFVGQRG